MRRVSQLVSPAVFKCASHFLSFDVSTQEAALSALLPLGTANDNDMEIFSEGCGT